MVFDYAGTWFQCPLSGLVGCNHAPVKPEPQPEVSMPFKRAGWLQRRDATAKAGTRTVSMPFKRAGWLQRDHLLT
mgnify:FL=1